MNVNLSTEKNIIIIPVVGGVVLVITLSFPSLSLRDPRPSPFLSFFHPGLISSHQTKPQSTKRQLMYWVHFFALKTPHACNGSCCSCPVEAFRQESWMFGAQVASVEQRDGSEEQSTQTSPLPPTSLKKEGKIARKKCC